MGYQDFITETEAAALAGVSTGTLMRFAEAGYIKMESDSDGLTLYCKSQISDVFGLKSPVKRKRAIRFQPPAFSSIPQDDFSSEGTGLRGDPETDLSRRDSVHGRVEVLTDQKNSALADQSTVQMIQEQTHSELPSELGNTPRDSTADALSSPQTSSPSQTDLQTTPASEASSKYSKPNTEPHNPEVNTSNAAELKIAPSAEASDETSPQHAQTTERYERPRSDDQRSYQADDTVEIARLQNLITLLEKLLELKSEQLAATEKERDWLRTRIERMEEKADRDQLLLMSETQMLRKLLEERASKRSLLRTALEWVGLAEPEKELSKRAAIEARDVSRG